MKREISQRWVMSFADLTLLLLGFFVLLQAQATDKLKMAAGIRGAFGGSGSGTPLQGFAAATLFEADEAILKPADAARFARMGAAAARKKERIIVSSQGHDGKSARLDSWELAAARTTAIARAIRAGGLPESLIEVTIPPMRDGDETTGQKIGIQRLAK